MALGNPPLDGTSLVGRLFAPLILPMLTFLITATYFFACQRRSLPMTNDEDITRPLITELDENANGDDGYPGFGSSSGTHSCGKETEVEDRDTCASPYGTI